MSYHTCLKTNFAGYWAISPNIVVVTTKPLTTTP